MNVGDIVRQSGGIIKFRKGGKEMKTSQALGVVVGIEEGMWSKDWDLTDAQKSWEISLGRRIDVLWSSGKLTKNFAEGALEVVSKQEKHGLN